ncbi:uncharacterized protein LOC103956832 [Pyrus x bretschneideri]|uniref:uncharacterized protein LOC103956832 n=1 Tax=Pyrus x bretschneideri TaxID=225117 RepID=UPI0020301D88|nr:uncharacterized protein LOC103956832 [Pyrus x bretschneideri]
MQYDQIKLNHIYGLTRGSIYPEESASDVSQFTANAKDVPAESRFFEAAGFSKTMHADMNMHSEDQLTESCKVVPSSTCLYRLVAIVEHFGRAGSGHYTVYRSMRADLCEEPCDESEVDAAAWCWYSISDSEMNREERLESSVQRFVSETIREGIVSETIREGCFGVAPVVGC